MTDPGPACVVCRCTEDRACEGGCAWRPGFLAIGMAVCDHCSIVFRLPLPANLGNERMHWAEKSAAQTAWKRHAVVAEPWLRGRRPRQPLAAAVLSAVLTVGQRMDEDNLGARIKWAVDLLVDRGWLVNDDPGHLTLLPVRQVVARSKQPHLTLILADRRHRVGGEAVR